MRSVRLLHVRAGVMSEQAVERMEDSAGRGGRDGVAGDPADCEERACG